MRATLKLVILFAFITTGLANFGCNRSSPSVQMSTPAESNKTQVTASSTSDWKVNVTDFTEPETVKIQSQLSINDVKPDQDRKWLVLTLELTPPKANATLPIKQFKLVHESATTETPLALTGTTESEAPRFTYLKESFGADILGRSQAGQGSVDKSGTLVWLYTQDAKSKDVLLTIMNAEPQKILFLFSVPATARKLRLQV